MPRTSKATTLGHEEALSKAASQRNDFMPDKGSNAPNQHMQKRLLRICQAPIVALRCRAAPGGGAMTELSITSP